MKDLEIVCLACPSLGVLLRVAQDYRQVLTQLYYCNAIVQVHACVRACVHVRVVATFSILIRRSGPRYDLIQHTIGWFKTSDRVTKFFGALSSYFLHPEGWEREATL